MEEWKKSQSEKSESEEISSRSRGRTKYGGVTKSGSEMREVYLAMKKRKLRETRTPGERL